MNKDKTNQLARRQSMQGEFDQTRAFLRQCMSAVVTGELNHVQAKDVAMLAQQQNYNMALEATLFPSESKIVKSAELIEPATAWFVDWALF